MKLDTIINLDPRMKQIVQTPTRLNPDTILDTITWVWVWGELWIGKTRVETVQGTIYSQA